MKKMTLPQFNPITTFDQCVDDIADVALRTPFKTDRASIELANIDFDAASVAPTWFSLPRAPHGNGDYLVAGNLSKKQLVDLYSDNMVKSRGEPRKIYDTILTAASGLCPFCGGLGHVYTLDHYLPKAYFPAYSVHPRNLVPCCRDCNSGKQQSFGNGAGMQTIHPYFDAAQFFEQRWIRAVVVREDPILIRFECSPPGHWSLVDQQRAQSHFIAYKLSARFSIQASGEVAKVVDLRRRSLKSLSADGFRQYLQDNADSTEYDLNGWNRTMYDGLATSAWFPEVDFEDPSWVAAP